MVINGTMFDCTAAQVLSDLRSYLEEHGIDLLARMHEGPTNVQVQCPYHSGGHERRPSAGVKNDTGIFHCFQCGETHSLPEVISYCMGKTDDMMGSYGWQWLVRRYLSVSVEERGDIHLDMSRGASRKPSNTYVDDETLNKLRYTHPYWKKRGIEDSRIIELFDLGYDRETRCITFPVRDVDGNCLFVARRSVDRKFFNYPSGSSKPLYGLYELHTLDRFPNEVWVTESMIDALRLWQLDLPAIALNGLGSSSQFASMSLMSCRAFVLATDNDAAGRDARNTIMASVTGKLFYDACIPSGRKDVGECSDDEIRGIKKILRFPIYK